MGRLRRVDCRQENMRARKNTSGIGNCQIPEKRYGIMSAPARYRENRTIQFTDRKHSYFTIANYSRYINRVGNNFPNEWQRDFLAKLTLYFHKLIDTIIQDPEEFNDYVANHLPYQQRDGKIARKEFNRIEPRFKMRSKTRRLQ